MANQKPNMKCRYSKCDKEYYACADSTKYGHYKTCGCCFEHFCMYQNEIAYFRGNEIPFPEFLEQMVKEGSLPNTVLPRTETYVQSQPLAEKPKSRYKKDTSEEI